MTPLAQSVSQLAAAFVVVIAWAAFVFLVIQATAPQTLRWHLWNQRRVARARSYRARQRNLRRDAYPYTRSWAK